jgi:hypothetical protein
MAMKLHRWEDLMIEKYGREGYERLRAKADEEIAHDPFIQDGPAVRDASRLPAEEIARIERRLFDEEDHADLEPILDLFRLYVEALGGELEIVARFGDKAVKLRGV